MCFCSNARFVCSRRLYPCMSHDQRIKLTASSNHHSHFKVRILLSLPHVMSTLFVPTKVDCCFGRPFSRASGTISWNRRRFTVSLNSFFTLCGANLIDHSTPLTRSTIVDYCSHKVLNQAGSRHEKLRRPRQPSGTDVILTLPSSSICMEENHKCKRGTLYQTQPISNFLLERDVIFRFIC